MTDEQFREELTKQTLIHRPDLVGVEYVNQFIEMLVLKIKNNREGFLQKTHSQVIEKTKFKCN